MALRELEEGIRQLQLRAGSHAGKLAELGGRVTDIDADLDGLAELLAGQSGTTAQRDAHYGTPATDAARAALANARVRYFNTETRWAESYYAPAGTAGLTARALIAGTPAGWYPIGAGPSIVCEPTGTFPGSAGGYLGYWDQSVQRNGGAEWFTADSPGIRFAKTGRYDLQWWTLQQSGGGQADYHTRINNSTDTNVDWMSNVHGEPLSAIYSRTGAEYRGKLVTAGQRLRVLVQSGTLTVHMVTTGSHSSAGARGQMIARYVGPALVSD